MTQNEVKSQILNLSAQIIMGNADKDEIDRVAKLAKDHNLLQFLKDEFLDAGRILAG